MGNSVIPIMRYGIDLHYCARIPIKRADGLMKKALLISGNIIFLLIVLLVMTTSIAVAAGGVFKPGTDGTPGNPWGIEDYLDLQTVSGSLSAHYELADNIICSGLFTPIGDAANAFSGNLDGKGFSISSMTINLPTTPYVGLFAQIENPATIQFVALENVNITGSTFVGGLIGRSNGGSISECSVTGYITGNNAVGGLVGYKDHGSISRCYTTAEVSGIGNAVGGLVGNSYGGSINDCYTTGRVGGVSDIGGLVGYSWQVASITNCYASGTVTGSSNDVGGLVGQNQDASVYNCFATGMTTGSSNTGGLVGNFSGSGLISNCYWANNQSSSSGGGIGVTDCRDFYYYSGTQQSVYEGQWDFTQDTGIWGIDEGLGYPYFGNPGIRSPVCEPISVVLMCIGLLTVVGFVWYRRNCRRYCRGSTVYS